MYTFRNGRVKKYIQQFPHVTLITVGASSQTNKQTLIKRFNN